MNNFIKIKSQVSINQSKEKYDNKVKVSITYLSYLLICLFAFLNATNLFSISNWFLIIAIVVMVLFSNNEQAFSLLFGFQILGNVIMIKTSSLNISFLFLLIPIVILKKIIKSDFIISLEKILILLILLVLEIINYTSYNQDVFGLVVLWYLSFIYYNVIASDNKFKLNIFNILVLTFISFFFMCLINMQALTNEGINGYNIFSYNIDNRLGNQYRILGGPNTLALFASIIIGVSLICFFTLEKKLYKVLSLIIVLTSIFFGLLTYSRAIIVELVIIFILLLFDRRVIKTNYKIIIFFLSLIFALVFIFSTDIGNQILTFFIDRFNGDESRSILLLKAFETIFSNIKSAFIGNGVVYQAVDGLDFTAHNRYIDAFVAFGLIGGSLYWFLHLIIYFSIKKRRIARTSLIYFSPLLIILSYSLIIGSVRDPDFYFILIFSFIVANNLIVEKKNESNNNIYTNI